MKHEFRVPDISCEHCRERVRKHLRTFDPLADVTIDLASRKVSVDGAADRSDYAYVIRDAGFTPA